MISNDNFEEYMKALGEFVVGGADNIQVRLKREIWLNREELAFGSP